MKREGVTMVLRVAAARLRRLHDAETAWAATTCDCHERTFLCTAWPFLCSHTNPQHRGFPFFSALATLQFNSKAPNKWLFTAWWLPMMAHQTSHASQWFRTELVCQTTTTTTTTTMRQQVAAECSGCMSLKYMASIEQPVTRTTPWFFGSSHDFIQKLVTINDNSEWNFYLLFRQINCHLTLSRRHLLNESSLWWHI